LNEAGRRAAVDLVDAFLEAGPDAFLSGEALSNRLGISRAALWKRMNVLRVLGFVFEGVRGSGYRLDVCPDLSDIELMARVRGMLGREAHFYGSLGSTNDRAMELATEGARHGTVALADTQIRGRGRLGRTWESPAGKNIYASVVLRPDGLDPRRAGMLPLLCAVSVAEAVALHTGLDARIKWPNDILASGRKLGGILCEMRVEPGRVLHAVAGIGVNVNMKASDFPADLRALATSVLIETGARQRRTPLLASVLDVLSSWFDRFLAEDGAPVAHAWRERSATLGEQVRVVTSQETLSGKALDIDDDGALLLELPGGEIRSISSGDVELLR
jgi:BirA family biotin operon repressor/biotin-[acetyl-CoA-carboxylase] ligase